MMLRLLGLAALVLLSGCSGFRSREAVTQVYVLQPPVAGATTQALEAGSTLAVLLPVVAPGLNNERIALLRSDGVFDSYAASRWPEVLPEVLQPLIIDALRAGGKFGNVQADTAPFAADWQLQLEVRQFTAVYGSAAAPTVRVQWVASIGRRADRKVLRSFVIGQSAPAAANRMGAVVAAFNAATAAALEQLVSGSAPIQ